LLNNNYHITEVSVEDNGNSHNNHPLPSSSRYEVSSEDVQDIMSKMPHWIVRQGTSVLFIVIILIFTGAYFIHYPDVIITHVTITSSRPPVKVVAQTNARIQQIFIRDNQFIKKNDPLCLLENPARYADMLLLKSILTRLDSTLILRKSIRAISFTHDVQLGELQAGYADLYQSVHQYLFFIERNFISLKVEQLQSQIGYHSQLNKELQNRDILLKQQLMLEMKKFQADSTLVTEKVIAPLEFANSRKELINKQMNADATKSGIIQNRLQQTEYLKTITDLQQQKLQQENDLQQKIRENVKRLQGQWEVWEQKYLMKSPVDGKVEFFNVSKENQYVTTGEPVLIIVPPVQNYIAKAWLPVNGAGKVKIGQKALIRLFEYPSEEFGMIKGKVATISAVALDTAYSMEIILEKGLSTTTNKPISPQPQLTGLAEVLTDDKNILQRLIEKMRIVNRR
jgi:multidrug resistance efflux pump